MALKRHDHQQSDRFIEVARKLEADDDEATFKAKLAAIARHKMKDEMQPSDTKGENAGD